MGAGVFFPLLFDSAFFVSRLPSHLFVVAPAVAGKLAVMVVLCLLSLCRTPLLQDMFFVPSRVLRFALCVFRSKIIFFCFSLLLCFFLCVYFSFCFYNHRRVSLLCSFLKVGLVEADSGNTPRYRKQKRSMASRDESEQVSLFKTYNECIYLMASYLWCRICAFCLR